MRGQKVKTKDTPPIMVLNSPSVIDILGLSPLSVHEKYFYGNSEAYGNLQDGESLSENPAISYFIGDA